jgi:hypothetical protein
MTKQEIWPKEGKLKKGIIIILIVILAATGITLLEEKTNFKAGKKLPLIIGLACVAVWFYPAPKKEKT